MANEEEPRNPEEPRGPEELSQDPFVERLRPDPSQPPEQVRVLEGLLGDSDREGYKRLYFSRELDNYAEFRTEDVVFSEPIPPDQPPFLGQQATRVGLRRDATVEYTRVRAPRPVDEFDLDVRLGAPESGRLQAASTIVCGRPRVTLLAGCRQTAQTQCGQQTCDTCATCGPDCLEATEICRTVVGCDIDLPETIVGCQPPPQTEDCPEPEDPRVPRL